MLSRWYNGSAVLHLVVLLVLDAAYDGFKAMGTHVKDFLYHGLSAINTE